MDIPAEPWQITFSHFSELLLIELVHCVLPHQGEGEELPRGGGQWRRHLPCLTTVNVVSKARQTLCQ